MYKQLLCTYLFWTRLSKLYTYTNDILCPFVRNIYDFLTLTKNTCNLMKTTSYCCVSCRLIFNQVIKKSSARVIVKPTCPILDWQLCMEESIEVKHCQTFMAKLLYSSIREWFCYIILLFYCKDNLDEMTAALLSLCLTCMYVCMPMSESIHLFLTPVGRMENYSNEGTQWNRENHYNNHLYFHNIITNVPLPCVSLLSVRQYMQ